MIKMSKHILILGAGQLGSRHLQALSHMNRTVEISVVDPDRSSLDLAKRRFEEMPENPHISSIEYHLDIHDLVRDVCVGIIATNADIRTKVVRDLVKQVPVSNLIIEKVLFQRIEDYQDIENLLAKNNINAWVNCPRRIWAGYRKLYEKTRKSKFLEVNISGSNFGLASNLIHFLDLIAFLTGENLCFINTEKLDKTIVKSKREQFWEVTGTINGSFEGGCRFSISSYPEGSAPLHLKIVTDSSLISITEKTDAQALVHTAEVEQGWDLERSEFKIPFQSQLSHLAVQDILNSGDCGLTPLSESVKIHISMIKELLSFFNQIQKQNSQVCQIT